MNETKLLQISLVVALCGLVALFFLADSIEVAVVAIDTITDEFIGQKVAVNGIVETVRQLDSMTLLEVSQQESVGSIAVVVFEQIDVSIGDSVFVSGTVEEYNGNIQIVADKVESG